MMKLMSNNDKVDKLNSNNDEVDNSKSQRKNKKIQKRKLNDTP